MIVYRLFVSPAVGDALSRELLSLLSCWGAGVIACCCWGRWPRVGWSVQRDETRRCTVHSAWRLTPPDRPTKLWGFGAILGVLVEKRMFGCCVKSHDDGQRSRMYWHAIKIRMLPESVTVYGPLERLQWPWLEVFRIQWPKWIYHTSWSTLDAFYSFFREQIWFWTEMKRPSKFQPKWGMKRPALSFSLFWNIELYCLYWSYTNN
jgi:hypothetical protein